MAHKDIDAGELATRTFVITMIGTVLYVAAVFIFII
jgi:hypothetical protein